MYIELTARVSNTLLLHNSQSTVNFFRVMRLYALYTDSDYH